MKYGKEIEDIITLDSSYVIAHCISADTAMEKGVVIPICLKYKGLKKACKDFVDQNSYIIGKAFRYKTNEGVVYNMFTRKNYWDNSQKNMKPGEYLSNLQRCLYEVKQEMLKHKETKLALPKIGCGLDRCSWCDVEAIIKKVFENTDFSVLVCIW